jgi:hypothetical protein
VSTDALHYLEQEEEALLPGLSRGLVALFAIMSDL